MASPSVVVSPPPDYIAELKCMLLVGNATGSFTDGVLCVKMVDNFLIEEKQMLKKIKKRNEVEAKARFEEAHNELRSQFFSLTSVVQCLVHDMQYKEVLDCLKTAASKSRSCWQTVICCLAAVIRGPQSTKESATAAYSALPGIIQHSRMLFFFLQVLKVAALNNKKAGWGRGLRSAVRKWYALLTPQVLLLELWHAPHAYGWAHKDVMRLAHIRPCDLAIGSRVVVQWYFSDLERTKIVFAAEKEAAYYIGLLDQLYNREHESNLPAMQLKVLLEMEDTNCYRLVRQQDCMLHHTEILSSVLAALDVSGATKAAQDRQLIKNVAPRRFLSQSSSHQQPSLELQLEESKEEITQEVLPLEPEPSPVEQQLSSALVQRLRMPDVAETASAMTAAIAMNNFLRRVKSTVENMKGCSVWRGGVPEHACVPPPAPLGQRISWHYTVPRHLRPILAQLDSTVLAAAQRCSIAASHPKMLVVFEPTSYCNLFLNTELGYNVHKQVRGTQAVSVCLYSLCYVAESEGEGFGDRAALYVGGTFRSYHPPSNKDFKGVTANLETTCKENCDQYALDFPKLSSHCAAQGKEEAVYFCDQINKVFLTAMLTYLKATPTGQGFTKLVLVGLMHTLLTPLESSLDSRLLVLNGFTERSVDVIQGFLDDDF